MLASLYSLKSIPTALRTSRSTFLSSLSSSEGLERFGVAPAEEWMPADAHELLCELGDRKAEVDGARSDRSLGHAAELGRPRLLREGDAVLCLDGAKAFGPV